MTEYPQDQSGEGHQPYSGQQQPYSGQPTPPPPPGAPGGPAPSYGQPPLGAVSPSDARMWSLFAQLGGILFGFIPSLVIYLIYKDRDPFIRRHASQALNFQIIILIAYIVSFMLVFVLIGIPLLIAVGICWFVFPILGAIAANKGEDYTYPLVPQMVT
jgi:uncharacterized Tic20 family protein